MTCVYCKEEDKFSVCIKVTPSCIQKFCFFVWTRTTWPQISESTFPLEYQPTTLEKQVNYLKYFATMSLWQSNDLSTMLYHQSFLVQCLLSSYWKLLPFLGSTWFFLSFLNHRVFESYVKSYVRSAFHYFYCFNGITNGYLKSVTMTMCQIGMWLNLVWYVLLLQS